MNRLVHALVRRMGRVAAAIGSAVMWILQALDRMVWRATLRWRTVHPEARAIAASLAAVGYWKGPLGALGLEGLWETEVPATASFMLASDLLSNEATGWPPYLHTAVDGPAYRMMRKATVLRDVIALYMDSPARFQGLHHRADAVRTAQLGTDHWHYDIEDRSVIKLFWSPLGLQHERGPTASISSVELTPAEQVAMDRLRGRPRVWGLTDGQVETVIARERWRELDCEPGEVLLLDTAANLHRGMQRSTPRYFLVAVFTSRFALRPWVCRQYRDRTCALPPVGGHATV
jgi:hypothetical protein